MKQLIALVSALSLAFFLGSAAEPTQQRTDKEVILAQRFSYPLRTCLVSGEKLGKRPTMVVVEKRLFMTCCDDCAGEVKKDVGKYAKIVEKAVIREQTKSYPSNMCLVSGEELGSMGDPIDVVRDNRLVRLCCKGCTKAFHKDPSKWFAKLDEKVIEKQMKSYPLDKCLVSNEPMTDAVNKVYGNTLVRFCCDSCVKVFEKSPQTFFASLREARAKRGKRPGDNGGDRGDAKRGEGKRG